MSSSPDTDTQTTASHPKKRRIRTDAQLEQKRARDRKSQRLSRAKNRVRIEQMEADLSSLKSRHESLLAAAEKIGINTSLVLSLAGEAISSSAITPNSAHISSMENAITAFTNIDPMSLDDVEFHQCRTEMGSQIGSEISDDGVHQNGLPSTANNSPVDKFPTGFNTVANTASLAPELPPNDPITNVPNTTLSLATQGISSAIDLCETLLQHTVESPAAHLAPPDADGELDLFDHSPEYEEPPTPIRTKTVPDCLCGIDDQHNHALHCINHKVVNLIVNTHAAIAAGMRKALTFPRSPSIPNLLLLDLDSNPLTSIVGRALLNSSPAQLADSVATYFIVYRLLRWRICPTPETYYDLPEWYRPSELQKTWPHPLCIDLLAWPKLRNGIIPIYEQLDKLRLSRDITESITVGWPEAEPLLVKDFRTNSAVLNPKFEEHIWKFSNWRMGPLWALRQPRFVGFVNMVESY
ncbi:hypothetical protein AOL_s00043g509 [Orbilia oligospora ATCC 24927]|uniref:BZIP domain-containing protein n=1 Tax=Arthrobotrys oligospora (strain ATCC 24927 / CBS 115.81 / DSM 1491) TaxID=756982 RepID=G1X485_ARTOA|nr:hypothetical protein AOL_s00043g509 [Orbilia oligospora ATCC 24927]EGX52119.1 hypothetical protein AOL_s00043g509 [Orbilia oligospora ATCC 24927]